MTLTFILLLILFTIEWTARKGHLSRVYRLLPPIFWIYFIPLVLSNLSLIPSQHHVYDFAKNYLLPTALALMLLNSRLGLIVKLGKVALLIMMVGSLGILIATPVTAFVFKPFVDREILSALGTLAASWMGGTFNMIAVKEATAISDTAFSPLIIVDTFVGYSWMGFLIYLSKSRFNKGAEEQLHIGQKFNEKDFQVEDSKNRYLKWACCFCVIFISFFIATSLYELSHYIPEIPGVITRYAWMIILITSLSLCFSIPLARKDYVIDASKMGQYLLYFILATIGAKAKLAGLKETFIYILAGLLMLSIHAAILFAFVKKMKVPLSMFAIASQANIGGVVSAPIVASVYHPSLAPIGLLMAIVGNITGTYLGILAVMICRWVGSF